MNRISGRVVLEESGVGIPDLVVAIYDVSASKGPTPAADDRVTVERASRTGISLGTLITGPDGRFELSRESTDDAAGELTLYVVVRSPEGGPENSQGAVLYSSAAPRRSSGEVEEFLIKLPADALIKAGVTPPAGSSAPAVEQPESALHAAKETLERRVELASRLQELASVAVTKERERAVEFSAQFRPQMLEELAGIGPSLPGYVPFGEGYERVRTENRKTVSESANRPRPPAVGYIQVPEAEVPPAWLTATTTPVQADAGDVERFLFGAAPQSFRAPERTRSDPLALEREREAEQDLLESVLATPVPAPEEDHETPPPSDPTPAPVTTPEDLPAFVHRLMHAIEDPDAPPTETRPDQAGVQAGTDGFALRGGPADVPAIYDFHNLQIAFDHVWTHAIDEDVLRVSTELYDALQDAGADPLGVATDGVTPLKALRSEAHLVARAAMPAVPAAIARPASPADVDPTSTDGTVGPLIPGNGLGFEPFPIGPFIGTVAEDTTRPRQPHELLDELEALLQEQYRFEIFAPGSVNFGLTVTYRQRWEPLTYQVGDLVKTITLTPKESRKVATKRVQRKERIVRELENSQEVRRSESSEQGRDEAEIVRKAQGKTSFSLSAEGSYDLGIAGGDSKTSFAKEAAEESADTKKAFREAVLKAAQEYKDERKLEVESKEVEELEATESVEISNPNDELTVTYLFYELQRRFKISEQLHRITPVVLVGMEVPNPSRRAIDRALLTHSWIINRVLLDDRYRSALNYLTTTIVGDELALRELLQTVNRLRQIVEATQRNHEALVREVKQRNAALEHMMELRAKTIAADESEGWIESITEAVVGEGSEESLEAVRIREENAKAHYEKAVREEHELRESLRSETAALQKATADYAQALAAHSNRLLEVAALRVHFKANVLYYMQAIWSHTFRDQTFFSVHKLKAPTLEAAQVSYEVQRLTDPPAHVVPKPGHIPFKVISERTFATPADPADPTHQAQDKTLAEIADLDNPLGFKGNYMIFPLKKSNALTDYMMTPYVDQELGLHDPDELGSWTPEEFVEHVKSLRVTLGEDFDLIRPSLEEQYKRLISAPRRSGEEVVVPTDSLYIEALPGAHPNLEDFKLRHRSVDVKKARAEVRRMELENLRYASRVLAGERDDPEIDKRIQIDGDGSVVVPPDV